MALDVIEKRHEAEVHMQLSVAMEKSQAGVVRHKVHFHLLITTQHDDILHDPGCCFASDPSQFEAMPMQMNRMDVIAGVAHAKSITFPLTQMKHRLHFVH